MKTSYTLGRVIRALLASILIAGCYVSDRPAAPENTFNESNEISLSKPGQCVAPPTGLVSWWPGDGTAIDIVGNNHGILQNGATFAPGMVGLAFSLDGTDDYVSVPNLDMNSFSLKHGLSVTELTCPVLIDY